MGTVKGGGCCSCEGWVACWPPTTASCLPLCCAGQTCTCCWRSKCGRSSSRTPLAAACHLTLPRTLQRWRRCCRGGTDLSGSAQYIGCCTPAPKLYTGSCCEPELAGSCCEGCCCTPAPKCYAGSCCDAWVGRRLGGPLATTPGHNDDFFATMMNSGRDWYEWTPLTEGCAGSLTRSMLRCMLLHASTQALRRVMLHSLRHSGNMVILFF